MVDPLIVLPVGLSTPIGKILYYRNGLLFSGTPKEVLSGVRSGMPAG